jgi:hypothetical protein
MLTRVDEWLQLYSKAPMIFDPNTGEYEYDLRG